MQPTFVTFSQFDTQATATARLAALTLRSVALERHGNHPLIDVPHVILPVESRKTGERYSLAIRLSDIIFTPQKFNSGLVLEQLLELFTKLEGASLLATDLQLQFSRNPNPPEYLSRYSNDRDAGRREFVKTHTPKVEEKGEQPRGFGVPVPELTGAAWAAVEVFDVMCLLADEEQQWRRSCAPQLTRYTERDGFRHWTINIQSEYLRYDLFQIREEAKSKIGTAVGLGQLDHLNHHARVAATCSFRGTTLVAKMSNPCTIYGVQTDEYFDRDAIAADLREVLGSELPMVLDVPQDLHLDFDLTKFQQ